MSVLDGRLAFVDIETTGMSYSHNRIIEVAIIRVENQTVVDTYTSLIDPQAPLPPFITGLTGIRQSDLASAPTFYDIADDVRRILDDAVFVAHNVRFDYGFLRQEFRQTGYKFNPKQLCTVKLSRALYPAERGHKLQNLIDRAQLSVDARHRAYDDAKAMWQFIQHVQAHFPAPLVESAVARQIKTPSLPHGLRPELVADLPEQPGVYIFQDEAGSPLYIGKSVNIKKRVQSHFSSDHELEKEFKITQQISNILALETAGELEALLLESRLIKEQQPLYNRQLRRTNKLTLARQVLGDDGYVGVTIEDVDAIDADNLGDILSVYTTKGKAREHLRQIVKDYGLCPRLMGLETGRGACFSYQLKRCSGACAGQETPVQYNLRLLGAFEGRRLEDWPYNTPVMIQEASDGSKNSSLIIDQWCLVASLSQEPDCETEVNFHEKMFDIDTYRILRSFLAAKMHKLSIKPISLDELKALAA